MWWSCDVYVSVMCYIWQSFEHHVIVALSYVTSVSVRTTSFIDQMSAWYDKRISTQPSSFSAFMMNKTHIIAQTLAEDGWTQKCVVAKAPFLFSSKWWLSVTRSTFMRSTCHKVNSHEINLPWDQLDFLCWKNKHEMHALNLKPCLIFYGM